MYVSLMKKRREKIHTSSKWKKNEEGNNNKQQLYLVHTDSLIRKKRFVLDEMLPRKTLQKFEIFLEYVCKPIFIFNLEKHYFFPT